MKNLINIRPLLLIALSFLLGICIGYFAFMAKILGLIISSFLFVLLFLCIFLFNKTRTFSYKMILSVILAVFFIVGSVSFTIRAHDFKNSDLTNGRPLSVKGRIIDVDEYSDRAVYTLKDLEFIGSKNFSSGYKLKLVSYDKEFVYRFAVGDVITFNDNVADVSIIYNGKFSAYNAVNKIKYSSSVVSDNIVKVGFYQNLFERLSTRVCAVFSEGLGEEERSVATALILGDTGDIDSGVLTNFRASGVAHVFAVSGLHIGFLTAILLFLFRFIRFNELLKIIVITIIIFLYSGVCGFSPSSIRACITCSVMLFAKSCSYKHDSLSALAFSAILLLLISPFNLFDVGFILSYVSVLGILLPCKIINRIFARLKPQKLRNALSITLSAFLTSTPIIAYYFNNFSIIGIITNLIFVPVVSVVFTILFVLTLTALIFGAEAVFLFVPNILIKVLLFVFKAVDFRIFVLNVSGLNGGILLYYFAIILSSDLVNIKRKTKAIGALIALVLCVACVLSVNAINRNRPRAYFIEDNGFGAVLFVKEDSSYLVLLGNETENAYNIVSSVIEESNIKGLDCLMVFAETGDGLIYYVHQISHYKNLFALEDYKDKLALYKGYLGINASVVNSGCSYTFGDLEFCYNSLSNAVKINFIKEQINLLTLAEETGLIPDYVTDKNSGVFKYIFAK